MGIDEGGRGEREACKNEGLRPDSSRELGVAGCAGSVQE